MGPGARMNLMAHWELKVVAFVLAVALWIYTGAQVRSERTVDIKILPQTIQGLSDNYRVTDVDPANFRVTFSVPSGLGGQLPTDTLTPILEINSSSLTKREQSFPLTSAQLGLSSDIRILRTEPNTNEIVVRFDYVAADDIPAAIPAISGLPRGLEAEITLEHTHIYVRAPSEAFDKLRARGGMLRYQPVDLSSCDPNAAGDQVKTVELIPLPDQIFQVMQPQSARVVVRPVSGSRLAVSLPVQVLAPAATLGRLQAEISQRTVTLSLNGPENLLRSLKADDGTLTAYVDLRDLSGPVADQELPVQLIGPPWVTADPLSIRVTVTAVSRVAETLGPPAPTPEHPHLQPGSATTAVPADGSATDAATATATGSATVAWPVPYPTTAP